jgi:hypothetical protein
LTLVVLEAAIRSPDPDLEATVAVQAAIIAELREVNAAQARTIAVLEERVAELERRLGKGICSGPGRSKVSGGYRGDWVKLCVHRARAMRASDEVTGATNEGLGLHSRPWRHADP